MIYDSFQINYEKLVIESSGLAAGRHKFSTVSDACDEIGYMLDVCAFTLPSTLVDSLSRVNSMLVEIKSHYIEKNVIEEIYIFNIKDVEFFKILEIVYNYMVPLTIKYMTTPEVSDKTFNEHILTGMITAESSISYYYSRILRNETQRGEIALYDFYKFDFKNSEHLKNTTQTIEDAAKDATIFKKRNNSKREKADQQVTIAQGQAPSSYRDMVISPLKPKDR